MVFPTTSTHQLPPNSSVLNASLISLSCVVYAQNYEAIFSNVSIVKFQIDFSYLMLGNFVVTFIYDSAHQLVCFVTEGNVVQLHE